MLIFQCDGSKKQLDEATIQKIDEFIFHVKRWNGLSLIAKSTVSDIWKWHVYDALSIFNLLQAKALNKTIIDFGAGGGVIGIPLAIAGIPNISLIERSETKAQFLKTVVKFESVYENLNDISESKENVLAIIRGVDKIDVILNKLGHKVQNFIFFKSLSFKNEIKIASKKWSFDQKIYNRYFDGKIILLEDVELRDRDN